MISSAATHALLQTSLAAALFATGLWTGAPVGLERDALRSMQDDSLAAQRAGAAVSRPLEESERAELRRLQERADDGLEQQRAAGLSNNSLATILLVLGIVALLVIIL